MHASDQTPAAVARSRGNPGAAACSRASSTSSARSIARQSAIRTSGRRYSPPCIGGALSISAARSLAAGAGSSRRPPPAPFLPARRDRRRSGMAKSRHQTSDGGRRLPASPAPSCRRPWPEPRAKPFSSRSASPCSSENSSSAGSRRSDAVRRQHRNERARHKLQRDSQGVDGFRLSRN